MKGGVLVDIKDISDIQAEGTVISTLFYHPEFILHSDHLKAGYFYNTENGCIYWAIQELYKAGIEKIDALNITNMLNSNEGVKKVIKQHNMQDIQKVMSMAEAAARHTLEEYLIAVDSVISQSFKRELLKQTAKINSACCNKQLTMADLTQMVNREIAGLTQDYMTTHDVTLLGDQIDEIWQEFENTDTSSRFPSKFQSFNDYFYYEPGELILLSARMKAGKSCFFLNEAMDKLRKGIPTLYIDTEVSTETFVKRLICNYTGIQFNVLQNKTYSADQKKRIDECLTWVRKQPFIHKYMPAPTMDEIYNTCKIAKYKMDLKFFIYDYIKSYNADAYANSALLGQMADFLKNKVAGELELAVLSGAQLGRNNMISNSDNIARAISTGIYWRFKTAEELARDSLDGGNVLAYVNINRNGAQTGEDEAIYFTFDGSRQRIEEAKIQKAKDDLPFTVGEEG